MSECQLLCQLDCYIKKEWKKVIHVDDEVVVRKIVSTKVVDDSDPIPMMENVKVESIVTGKDKKQMKKTRPTIMEVVKRHWYQGIW